MTFYRYQRVVCINDNWCPPFVATTCPKAGVVYTIRSLFEAKTEQLCIRLVEILNPLREYNEGYMEAGFVADNFRPLCDKKTDISIFEAMLKPNKVNV